jgi:hypothetical protein
LRRKLIPYLALLCIIVILAVIYASLNLPNYGNVLPPYDSSRNPVNLVFKFGTTAKNELNTFHGTFTKDLIIDGTVTARLIMSQEELKQIQQILVEIDFFNYPETFPLKEPLTVPGYSYYLMVQNGTIIKEVTWGSNSIINDENLEDNLNQLAYFLTNMITQKPEYTRLPPAEGGYL